MVRLGRNPFHSPTEAQLIALLCAVASAQIDVDAAELRERWQIAESLYDDEISRHAKSTREQDEAIQREPDEARKRELSDELEAYNGQVSPLLFGIRRAVDSDLRGLSQPKRDQFAATSVRLEIR